MKENILKCILCSSESKLIVLSDNLRKQIRHILLIPTQVFHNQELQLICISCHDSVSAFYRFKKKIMRNLNLWSNSKNESGSEINIDEKEESHSKEYDDSRMTDEENNDFRRVPTVVLIPYREEKGTTTNTCSSETTEDMTYIFSSSSSKTWRTMTPDCSLSPVSENDGFFGFDDSSFVDYSEFYNRTLETISVWSRTYATRKQVAAKTALISKLIDLLQKVR